MRNLAKKDKIHGVHVLVQRYHFKQKRKYTGEPYVLHVQDVAQLVEVYAPKTYMGVEIALCHDLFEDTTCTENDLHNELLWIGYSLEEAKHVVSCVKDLTDVYTPKSFPDLNRKARKELEAKRLITIHPGAQTVKYADILNNIGSIGWYDPKFAKVYTKEIEAFLPQMDKGNFKLYKEALLAVGDLKEKLEAKEEYLEKLSKLKKK